MMTTPLDFDAYQACQHCESQYGIAGWSGLVLCADCWDLWASNHVIEHDDAYEED